MSRYLLRHLQVLVSSAGTMLRSPGATVLTATVIGITLALPVILYLLVDNLERATRDWEGRAQLTLYLDTKLTPAQQQAFVTGLKARPGITRLEFISADAALSHFKQDAGFAAALNALDHNPLPPSVVLYLDASYDQSVTVTDLARELEAAPEVDTAQADTAWVQRLHAILQLIERGVWIIAALLGFAVIVIISNTIRLHILNRRDEIEIIKLIGGSNAFIRRPFLYTGLLQGLTGAVLALLLVIISMTAIHGPADQLAGLYGAQFRLYGLRGTLVLGVLLSGSILGWLASRWAVQRHLARIEPQ